MEIGAINSLKAIGLQLDRNQYPSVYNNGIVKPGGSVIDSLLPGEKIKNESEKQKRSPPRSREGPTRLQGSPRQPRPTNETSQFFRSCFRDTYETEVDELQDAYPGTKIWQQADGMWLRTESTVLAGLEKKATFLTAIPFSKLYIQKSWGFWTTHISSHWIGPRHTNFPDGSVCAFNPADGTWKLGDKLTDLLDLYTLWALRYEHLNTFGRWPGRQTVPHAYERITESSPEELCGCDKNSRKYSDCCQESDLIKPLFKSFSQFMLFTRGYPFRSPPSEIVGTIKNHTIPPLIKNYIAPILLTT